MNIQRGTYPVEDRGLRFELAADLSPGVGTSCVWIRGENGLGKTTFLERVVIARLNADGIDYLYVGQDIRTQIYTLRAMLSVRGHHVFGTDEKELFRLWIGQSPTARVLILDEFDKYFQDYRFVFDWSRAFIQTYIVVSHAGHQRMFPSEDRLAVHPVLFTASGYDGGVKRVRILLEQPWSF